MRILSGLGGLRRWLVVDDSKDDAEAIQLALEDMGASCEVAHTLQGAEKLLRTHVFDCCVLDCILREPSIRGEDLIPVLRELMPGLPVVMLSNSPDDALPSRVVQAGADVFIPKLNDHECFMLTLRAAALQAQTIRRLKLAELTGSLNTKQSLFISAEITARLEQSLKRKNERILINGESGTGKSTLALRFAEAFIESQYGSSSRSIVVLDCQSIDEEDFWTAFSGKRRVADSSIELNYLQRAQGGVLIIENIQAISEELQAKVKSFFEELFAQNMPRDAESVKFVFTCQTNSPSGFPFIPGFVETLAQREIDLPAARELGKVSDDVVAFLLNHELDLKRGEDHYNEMFERMVAILQENEWPGNFRSLVSVLRQARDRAKADGRNKVFASDLFVPMIQKCQTSQLRQDWFRQFEPLFDFPEGKTLFERIAAGENYEEAKKTLRMLMFRVAAKRFNNNKTHMSRALGISRQSLYDVDLD